jgi:hypothetical protein
MPQVSGSGAYRCGEGAVLDRLMGRGDLVEPEPQRGQLGQFTRGDGRAHPCHRLCECLRRDVVDEHEPQRQVALHEGPHRRCQITVGGVGDHHGVLRRNRDVERGVCRRGDLDDAVDAARRGGQDGRARILGAVVHNRVGARRPRERRLLVGADRADNPGPGPAAELDREVAHRPGSAGDEHGLSVDRPVCKEAVVGGHGGDTEVRSQVERGRIGQPHRLALGDADPLRGGAVLALVGGEVHPHALPGPGGVDPRADHVDLAGAVLVRHQIGERWRGSRRAGAALPIGRVHSRDAHPHAHLARTGLGPLDLGHPQHLAGRPVPVIHRRAHRLAHGRASVDDPAGPVKSE